MKYSLNYHLGRLRCLLVGHSKKPVGDEYGYFFICSSCGCFWDEDGLEWPSVRF